MSEWRVYFAAWLTVAVIALGWSHIFDPDLSWKERLAVSALAPFGVAAMFVAFIYLWSWAGA